MENLVSRSEWVNRSTFHSLSQTETLQLVLSGVKKTRASSENAIVLIDLDSTLYDVRHRTHQIIQSWLEVAKELPGEIQEKLKGATLSSIGYSLKDTFHTLELDLKKLHIEKTWVELKEYWWDHFFSNEQLKHDKVQRGAVEYVHNLKAIGASIIYLTGRETAKMGAGTLERLTQDGFPMDGTRLIMREDPKADDRDHKTKALRTIITQGTVIASFENEPRNLMALVDVVPSAMHIFVDTACSESPAKPGTGLYRIKDFVMES